MRSDPTALAPERLLVFEVRGSIQNFANAVRKIDGMEFVGEEDLPEDEDKAPVAYLMCPDMRALGEIKSLWERWQRGEAPKHRFTAWRDVFNLLRDLRTWGPQDRVSDEEANILLHSVSDRDDDEAVRLEIELVHFRSPEQAATREAVVRHHIEDEGGRVIDRARLPDIAYHALLVELPARAVRALASRRQDSIAGLDPVMYIRPQSLASSLETAEPAPSPSPTGHKPELPPILALLDGVPIAQHPLLAGRLTLVDQFDLEPATTVDRRVHGTAMASLIVHGDRNRSGEAPLPRRVHVVPVIGGNGNEETFPRDRLAVDVIWQAIKAIREDPADAPEIVIVNLSLGNRHLPFHGTPSAWARLLDRLAWHFGLLFLVSAGNLDDDFDVPGFAGRTPFEDADAEQRSRAVIGSIDAIKADRRLFAPAESLNAVTVGAANICETTGLPTARAIIDPHEDITMSNPSSALGPGIGQAVKPDILFAGGREHVLPVTSGQSLRVRPAAPTHSTGLKVAAPPAAGEEARESWTLGTSAATALASRTCHRIHDALEDAHGELFTSMPHRDRAVLLKALLAHPAAWPPETAARIKDVVGPANGRQHARQKDNIRRYLGYGIVNGDDAVACAADRATFWATGRIGQEESIELQVPIPQILGILRCDLIFAATLAWFTPIRPGMKSYKVVKLVLSRPDEETVLRLEGSRDQPDQNQSRSGTLTSRRWQSDRSQVLDQDSWERLTITRMPDQGDVIEDAVPFALAVTLAAPGVASLYEDVRAMVNLRQQARARAGV